MGHAAYRRKALDVLFPTDIKFARIGVRTRELWLPEVGVSELFSCTFPVKIPIKRGMLSANREFHDVAGVIIFPTHPGSRINLLRARKDSAREGGSCAAYFCKVPDSRESELGLREIWPREQRSTGVFLVRLRAVFRSGFRLTPINSWRSESSTSCMDVSSFQCARARRSTCCESGRLCAQAWQRRWENSGNFSTALFRRPVFTRVVDVAPDVGFRRSWYRRKACATYFFQTVQALHRGELGFARYDPANGGRRNVPYAKGGGQFDPVFGLVNGPVKPWSNLVKLGGTLVGLGTRLGQTSVKLWSTSQTWSTLVKLGQTLGNVSRTFFLGVFDADEPSSDQAGLVRAALVLRADTRENPGGWHSTALSCHHSGGGYITLDISITIHHLQSVVDPPESIGRGGWSEFSQLLDIARPEYRDFLVELGFGPFLSIRYVHVRHPLVRCWVERFFHHTGTIHLSTCEVGVLPVDWSAILGIRFGGRIPPSDPVSDFEALEILGIDDPAAIVGKRFFHLKISYLKDLLVREIEEPPTELRYRQWTAYFIFSCFLGNDKSTIPTPIVVSSASGSSRFSGLLSILPYSLLSRLPAAPDSAFLLARRWDSAWIQRLTTRTLMECRTTVDCIRDVDIVFQPYSTFLLERPEVFRAMELSRLRIWIRSPRSWELLMGERTLRQLVEAYPALILADVPYREWFEQVSLGSLMSLHEVEGGRVMGGSAMDSHLSRSSGEFEWLQTEILRLQLELSVSEDRYAADMARAQEETARVQAELTQVQGELTRVQGDLTQSQRDLGSRDTVLTAHVETIRRLEDQLHGMGITPVTGAGSSGLGQTSSFATPRSCFSRLVLRRPSFSMMFVWMCVWMYGCVSGCMDVFLAMCLWLWLCVYGYVYGYWVSILREAWFINIGAYLSLGPVFIIIGLTLPRGPYLGLPRGPFQQILGLTPPRGPVQQILGLTPPRGPVQQILGLTPPRGPFPPSLGLTPSRGPFQQILGLTPSRGPSG
uniref:Aminotransferase-like plant mobile domain-containing protein n=1 Tax=Fagus sylvatica TaxID=28930 RepID=A0A2N9HRE7_FAGSY